MPFTAVLANNKGGVSKTSVTVHLADALARTGRRVLVADMDPQANASRRLGIEWTAEDPFATVSEVIYEAEDGAGAGAVLACGWDEKIPTAERIDVLPSRFDLQNRESEASTLGAVRRLKRGLKGWTDDYDVILIDTPPSMGHLTQMALAAADTVLLITDPKYDGVEAAIRLRDFVERHADDLGNSDLRAGGLIVTRNRDTAEHRFQIEGARERFGDLFWDLRTTRKLLDGTTEQVTPTAIPEWARFDEADSAATSLTAWRDGKSIAPVAIYDALAARLVRTFLND